MEPWQQVRDALFAVGFSPNVETGEDSYVGSVSVGRVNVGIEITISDFEFIKLPQIRITNREQLPKKLTAHTMAGDRLCYADKATFLLDRYAPDQSVMRVLEQAKTTLNLLLHGNPTEEFMAELAAYWSSTGYCLIDDPRKLKAATFGSCDFGNGPQVLIAGESIKRLERWAKAAGGKFKKIFDAPVVQAVAAIRPPPKGNLTLKEVVDWMEPQLNSAKPLMNLITRNFDQIPALLVAADNALIGFRANRFGAIEQAREKGGFRKSTFPSLWKKYSEKIEIETFYCQFGSQAEITERNLDSSAPLAGKKIALIGCGTIGSYLSRTLVQNGAGHGESLLVVDNDALSPENLGRHALGARYLWRMKAKAVAEWLIADFPDADIFPTTQNAAEILPRLHGYDLVIDATGDEQFSNALNAHALEANLGVQKFPPVLFAMIFGNGLAVQTYAARWDDDHACFRCLKPGFADNWRYNPIRHSASETHTAVRPCAQGAFIPFSVAASLACASLAVNHALHLFSPNYSGDLRTHALDPENAKHIPSRSVSQSDRCPACN